MELGGIIALTVVGGLITVAFVVKLVITATMGICTCKTDMTRKVVLVTGANSGIGFETALELARRGAKVILACRNEERGRQAADDIVKQTSNDNVHLRLVDLCSFQSVRKFCLALLEDKEITELHVLVNNAGLTGSAGKITEDGIDSIYQSNYYSHFLLTMGLMPLLKTSAPSRVVNVSSEAHRFVKTLQLDDTKAEHVNVESTLYGRTKLMQILFTKEFARRFGDSGVSAYALHPGFVRTSFLGNLSTPVINKIVQYLAFLYSKSPREGAQTTLHLSVAPLETLRNGGYYSDCKLGNPNSAARKEQLGKDLWEFSEKITTSEERRKELSKTAQTHESKVDVHEIDANYEAIVI